MPPFRQIRRSLPIALLRARETVMGPLRDMLSTSGVNEQKWRVLRVLQEKGPLELSQVAAEAVLLLSSLTRMVGPMVDEPLLFHDAQLCLDGIEGEFALRRDDIEHLPDGPFAELPKGLEDVELTLAGNGFTHTEFLGRKPNLIS